MFNWLRRLAAGCLSVVSSSLFEQSHVRPPKWSILRRGEFIAGAIPTNRQ
jgi:hypothetical protein